MTYTYNRHYAAHTTEDGGFVYLPDQVADDQKAYDQQTFPVLCRDGSHVTAKLRGDLYGLWTPGTGDAIVEEV